MPVFSVYCVVVLANSRLMYPGTILSTVCQTRRHCLLSGPLVAFSKLLLTEHSSVCYLNCLNCYHSLNITPDKCSKGVFQNKLISHDYFQIPSLERVVCKYIHASVLIYVIINRVMKRVWIASTHNVKSMLKKKKP